KKFDLVLLEDDRRFFPRYLAMPLVRGELNDSAKQVLEELFGTMTQEEMQSLNQSVQEKKSLRDIAAQWLRSKGLLTRQRQPILPGATEERTIDWPFLLRCTLTHLQLTFPRAGGWYGGCHPAGGPGLSPRGRVEAGALRRWCIADHPVDRSPRLHDPRLR